MKKTLLLMTVIGFTSASLFMGCNVPSDKKVENSRENVAEAQRDLADAKVELKTDLENFRRDTEVQLSKNRNEITVLRGKAANVKAELRDSYNANITELETKNTSMETRLNGFKSEKNDDWQNFKNEFSRDMDALGLAFKDIAKDNVN